MISRQPVAELPKSSGVGRRRKAGDADAVDLPRARRRSARPWRPAPAWPCAVLSTSSPSSRPEMRVVPTASAPRISARCEIDLSPGTRTRPWSGAPRRAVSGEVGDGVDISVEFRSGAAPSTGRTRGHAAMPARDEGARMGAPRFDRSIDRAAAKRQGENRFQPVTLGIAKPWQSLSLVRSACAPIAARSSTISVTPRSPARNAARCSRRCRSRRAVGAARRRAPRCARSNRWCRRPRRPNSSRSKRPTPRRRARRSPGEAGRGGRGGRARRRREPRRCRLHRGERGGGHRRHRDHRRRHRERGRDLR